MRLTGVGREDAWAARICELSDRIGRKPLIVWGMWIQAVGIAVMVVVHGFMGFVIGALLLGIGTAMVYPALLAAIGDVAHPSWRASAVGVYRLWRDLGYAIGALLAGLTADAFGCQPRCGSLPRSRSCRELCRRRVCERRSHQPQTSINKGVGQLAMAKQIDVETLQGCLDAQQPVTVVDVRTDEDRAQWAIPGSVHVNAYHALRAGEPGALADMALPPDRPIVTVCGAGRMSLTAADFLTDRGFDVRSLTGGMKAWSLAWNTARVPIKDDRITIVQVRRTGKGCLSYVLMCDGDAAVIDASLPPEVYEDIARPHGARIRRVIETHIHADHLSRARQLADRVPAPPACFAVPVLYLDRQF